MALQHKTTGEYLKIDFGYIPQPIAKIFKNKAARDGFNPTFDTYKRYDFNTEGFNAEIALLTPDPTLTFIDNFKKLAYEKIKTQLNVTDENGVVEVIWEDC